MCDEMFTFESFINWWRDLIRMGSLEDHKDFEHCTPSFGGLELALLSLTSQQLLMSSNVEVDSVACIRNSDVGYSNARCCSWHGLHQRCCWRGSRAANHRLNLNSFQQLLHSQITAELTFNHTEWNENFRLLCYVFILTISYRNIKLHGEL